jgi:succinate dehydrogenase cytochrome b556 subunit
MAWIVHRVSGILLALYLFAHLYALSSLVEPGRFDALMELMRHPAVTAGELALLAVVAAHALGGIRLMLLELGASTRLQKPLFKAAAVVFLAVMILGAFAFTGGAE